MFTCVVAWRNPMNNSKDERMKCLKDMGYRMWDKGLWDQRIVDCYFQMLMEMDNPNVRIVGFVFVSYVTREADDDD